MGRPLKYVSELFLAVVTVTEIASSVNINLLCESQVDKNTKQLFSDEHPISKISHWLTEDVKTLYLIRLTSYHTDYISEFVTGQINTRYDASIINLCLSYSTFLLESEGLSTFPNKYGSVSFLIVVTDIGDLTKLIDSASKSYFFDNRSKFMVVHLCDKEKNFYNISNMYGCILSRLWNVSGILNMAIYTSTLRASEFSDTMITFNPFIKPSQYQKVKITSTSLGLIGRKTANLHEHPVRVTLFLLELLMVAVMDNGTVKEFTGRDGCMLKAISRKMNFTPVILMPNDGATYGYLMEDGTYRGTLGHLVNNRADLSINSRYIRDYGSRDVEFTAPAIAQERLCVLTPRAATVPTWVAMVRCYSWQMWALIALTFLASSLVWTALCFLDHPSSSLPLHEHLVLMLNIFLSNTVVVLGKYASHSQREFLASCMLFSIVIINIFVGNIYNALTVQRYFPDIRSLQDLDNSGIKIAVFYRSMIDTFDDVKNPVLKNLNSKFFFTKSSKLLYYVTEIRNLSIVNTETYLRFVIKDTRHGEEKLNIVDECPRTYGVSYIVPRKSPYREEFNRIISHLTEAGHVKKWTEDYIYKTTTTKRIKDALKGVHEDYTKVFTLADLQAAFYVLILGLSISATVLMNEILKEKLLK